MNVLPIILTELWMDEYPKCPVRDKTNTEESPGNETARQVDANTLNAYNTIHGNSVRIV